VSREDHAGPKPFLAFGTGVAVKMVSSFLLFVLVFATQ